MPPGSITNAPDRQVPAALTVSTARSLPKLEDPLQIIGQRELRPSFTA